jgi:hypothetical protein
MSDYGLVNYKDTKIKCRLYWCFIEFIELGGAGGGVSICVGDHILQEFNTLCLTRFKTYKLLYHPQNKFLSAGKSLYRPMFLDNDI